MDQKYIVISRAEMEGLLAQMRPESSATVIFYIRETNAGKGQHSIHEVLDPKTGQILDP